MAVFVYMFSCRLTILGCIICTVSSETSPPPTTEVSGFRILFNAYRQCSDQQEMVVCLKSRALRMIDRAIQMENIQISDGNNSSNTQIKIFTVNYSRYKYNKLLFMIILLSFFNILKVMLSRFIYMVRFWLYIYRYS